METEKFIRLILFIGFVLFGTLFIINHNTGFTCKISNSFNDDIYCYKQYDTRSNLTSSGYTWEKRSHEQDRLNDIAAHERFLENEKLKQEAKICYDNGYLTNETFTIRDYGLTCKRIDYLNNHLIDNFEKKDAGRIYGKYSGLFGSGYIKGEQYQHINERVVASGKLIQNINYWNDCNEVKYNENIDYFTEEEFVMYYVEECIK